VAATGAAARKPVIMKNQYVPGADNKVHINAIKRFTLRVGSLCLWLW
jgi:hypothetical protein